MYLYIDVLNQSESSNDDDAPCDTEFWQNFGTIEDGKFRLKLSLSSRYLLATLLEEPLGAPEPKPAHFYSPKLVGWMQDLPGLCRKAWQTNRTDIMYGDNSMQDNVKSDSKSSIFRDI